MLHRQQPGYHHRYQFLHDESASAAEDDTQACLHCTALLHLHTMRLNQLVSNYLGSYISLDRAVEGMGQPNPNMSQNRASRRRVSIFSDNVHRVYLAHPGRYRQEAES